MTTNQLQSLSDDEKSLLFYIINIANPIKFPQIEFNERTILWIKHQELIKKIAEIEKNIKDENKGIFDGLLNKLDVTVNRNK